jgi:N6-adenosine-specific RNA methylase IME4
MKYRTILMDPPWPSTPGRRQTELACSGQGERFGKVSLADLERFPLNDLADTVAHCYIWVMNIHSFEATVLRIMEQAGFTLTNRIVWVKTSKKTGCPLTALGHYFRLATEYLLFEVKGGLPAMTHSLSNVLLAPRQG